METFVCFNWFELNMRLKLTITLDRNLQQNNTTVLTSVKYGVISRLVAFTSENKFFTFFRIAWHVVLKRFSSPFDIHKPGKGTPFGRNLPLYVIIGSTPPPRAPPFLFWPVLKKPTLTRVSDRDHCLGFVFNVLQATLEAMAWSSWNSHLRDTLLSLSFFTFQLVFD